MKKAKARLVTMGVTLLAAAFMCGAAIMSQTQASPIDAGPMPHELDYSDHLTRETPPLPTVEPVRPYQYIAKEYMGFVAIFTADDVKKPMTVTDIPVAILPEHDRQKLLEGIILKDDEELAMILEDFSS